MMLLRSGRSVKVNGLYFLCGAEGMGEGGTLHGV